MNDKPILFYSKQNGNCINLWNNLAKSNQLNNFIKICVDGNNKIPPMITTVPSIFIKGRPIITGAGIGMYSNSNNSMNTQSINTIANKSNTNKGTLPPIQQQTAGPINDFNPVEMSDKWSDSYSFISEQGSSEPLSYCYQFLNESANSANTPNNCPPQQTNIATSNKKNSQIDDRLEKLQMERGLLNNSFR